MNQNPSVSSHKRIYFLEQYLFNIYFHDFVLFDFFYQPSLKSKMVSVHLTEPCAVKTVLLYIFTVLLLQNKNLFFKTCKLFIFVTEQEYPGSDPKFVFALHRHL